ncbi:MAG: GNAT family N-acetyltransferase [Phycisphaeraceae bacterium]
MSGRDPEIQWQHITLPQRPPDAAETLLGTEARRAFDNAGGGGVEPVVVAATRGDQWLAAMLVFVEPEHALASIRQLVVVPAARGQGLGGRLVRRAVNLAREHNARRVRSTAGFGCPDHRHMYERLGFEDTDADERPYLMSRAV